MVSAGTQHHVYPLLRGVGRCYNLTNHTARNNLISVPHFYLLTVFINTMEWHLTGWLAPGELKGDFGCKSSTLHSPQRLGLRKSESIFEGKNANSRRTRPLFPPSSTLNLALNRSNPSGFAKSAQISSLGLVRWPTSCKCSPQSSSVYLTRSLRCH